MRILTHDEVLASLSPAGAVDGLRQALRESFDPATDLPRIMAPLHRGETHILPASLPRVSGMKILAIQPEDHDPVLPLIQG